MEIIVLMAQRKCRYPGEYGPEALACMTEYEYSDNPDYLTNQRDETIGTGEFDAVELVTLTVPADEIVRRLYPMSDPVPASCA